MPYTIKPGSFKYKKSNGQFSEIDCFEGPDLTEEVAALEKGKAPIIIDSATGNPIAIKDGADGLPVEGMKIHFNPVQSGTGDPSPSNIRPIEGWMGVNAYRAGKNLFDPAKIDRTSTIYNIRVYKNDPILLPAGTYTMSCSEECNGLYVEQGASDIFTKYNSTFLTFTLNEATKVSFNFYTVNAFASDAVVQLEVGSVATPYTPYTGVSYSVEFPVLGKNLCNGTAYSVNISNDIPQVLSRTPITSPFTTTYNYSGVGFIAKVNANITYALSSDATGANIYFYCGLYSSLDDITDRSKILQHATTAETFTPIADGYLVFMRYSTSLGTEVTWSYAQCEEGSVVTTYEPYVNIYGGTLDTINRALMIEWVKISSTDLVWNNTNQSANGVFRANLPSNRLLSDRFNIISDEYKSADSSLSIAGMQDNTTKGYDGLQYQNYVYIRDSRFTNKDDFSENVDCEIVYQLAEPIEIPMSDIIIPATLIGDNTIWSDANGTIELNYRADTKLFCQKNDQVNDVQINGTSILNAQGVANVPIADGSTFGVMKIQGYYGHSITNGVLTHKAAETSTIKSGNDKVDPIVSYNQHLAVFYGLAKASGDTSQASSSNPVGQFTDDALVKIQKMLGVYQAPWELIREDSFTNDLTTASDHIITVDSNGQSFELTDALMLFELPQNENTAEKGYYGQIWFYYDTDSVIAPEPGSASRAANGYSQGAWYMINYSNKIVTTQSTVFTTNTNSTYWRARYIQYMNGAANSNMGMFVTNDFAINKINIKQVKGEGHYKLYGRRKWTT